MIPFRQWLSNLARICLLTARKAAREIHEMRAGVQTKRNTNVLCKIWALGPPRNTFDSLDQLLFLQASKRKVEQCDPICSIPKAFGFET